MSGGSANYDISEILKNVEAEGFKGAEVEAVLKIAGDDKTWNAMEDLVAAIGAGQDANKGLLPMPIIVNPDDPHVIEIAKYAVETYNEKARTKLAFVKVVFGIKWNIVAGTFYLLLIETQDSEGTYYDKALVFETIIGYKKLIWYKH